MKISQLFWFLLPTFGLFMADPADGGGSANPEPPTSGEGGDPPTDGSTAITFNSQADLDALFKPRMEAAAAKAKAELLSSLGVENEGDITKAIQAAEAAKQAQMTELEKAQAEIAKAQDEATKAKAEAATVQAQAQEALMKAAVMGAASNFQDPTDAWLYIDRSKITVDDNGGFQGVEDAVKVVSEAKTYLLKSENGSGQLGTPPRRQTPVRQAWQQSQNGQPPSQSNPDHVPTVRF